MEENILACNAHGNDGWREGGYTLIEVLIAIAIFSIGMLAIGSMQLGATKGTATAQSNTELAAYATDQMERLTGLPYDHADIAEGTHNAAHPNDNRFSVTWVIDDEAIFPDIKTITLTAREELRNNTRTLTFQNAIPRRD